MPTGASTSTIVTSYAYIFKCANYVSVLNNILFHGLHHFQIRVQAFHNRPSLAKHRLDYHLVSIGRVVQCIWPSVSSLSDEQTKVISRAAEFCHESTLLLVASGCAGPNTLEQGAGWQPIPSKPKVTDALWLPTVSYGPQRDIEDFRPIHLDHSFPDCRQAPGSHGQ